MTSHKPDIVEVASKEGIELKQKGKSCWGQCPFHEDNTPSFKIDSDKQLFYCFGCGSGGDVISFIQKLKRCSFPDAVSYLRISNSKPPKINRRNIRKKELLNDFNEWCNTYYCKLADVYREFNHVKSKMKSMSEIDKLTKFYHEETVWEYHMDILLYGSDEQKYQLYLEVKNEQSTN